MPLQTGDILGYSAPDPRVAGDQRVMDRERVLTLRPMIRVGNEYQKAGYSSSLIKPFGRPRVKNSARSGRSGAVRSGDIGIELDDHLDIKLTLEVPGICLLVKWVTAGRIITLPNGYRRLKGEQNWNLHRRRRKRPRCRRHIARGTPPRSLN